MAVCFLFAKVRYSSLKKDNFNKKMHKAAKKVRFVHLYAK